MTVWVKLNTDLHVHHQIHLGGEGETAVLVSELKEGLPLIGWLDGEKEQVVDVNVWSNIERGILKIEFKGEGVSEIEGGIVGWDMQRGPPLYGDVKVYTKSNGSVVYSVAMVMEDFTIIMLKSKGRIIVKTCMIHQ